MLATKQASTSGTAIGFTSIPSWVKRITINFVGVSTGSTGNIFVQIGDSGGIEATGYLGTGFAISNSAAVTSSLATTGFAVILSAAAAVIHGSVTLTLEDAATNTWVCSGTLARSDDAAFMLLVAGSKSLSATLDRVRIATTPGTSTLAKSIPCTNSYGRQR